MVRKWEKERQKERRVVKDKQWEMYFDRAVSFAGIESDKTNSSTIRFTYD